MLRVISILAVCFASVLAALFAILMAFVHGFTGGIVVTFLWIGAAMLAILFANIVVVTCGKSPSTDDDSMRDDVDV